MHVSNLGENHLKLDCYFKSKEDILEMVRQAAKEAEPGEWIQGSGWLDTLWDEPGFPSKEELDAVAPNNPVYLLRADNHMGWFNSMALEMAGITKDTPEPQGGQILKTDNGELLGCLTDNAASMVIKVIPTWSAEAQKNAVLMAQEELFSYGFTSATDAGTKVNYIQHYEDLDETGQHGFAAEVGDLSSRTHIGLRTGLVAHIQDAVPLHRHSGGSGEVFIHGVDVAVDVEAIRHLRRACGHGRHQAGQQ